MKIFVLDAINRKGVDILSRYPGTVLWDDPRIASWREEAEGIILRGNTDITAADMARAPHLKAISKHGTGVDRIDLEAARGRGIAVMNTPSLNADAVSEMAMAMTLALARQVAFADRILRSGKALRREDIDGSAGGTGGRSMDGKTVAVLGLGSIGRRVAERWRLAFGATVLGYDPHLPESAWGGLGCERVERLDDLLPRADLVSIHVPLTTETRHLIGARQLALMKPSAILVNLARGGVVDEDALYEALVTQRIFAAALDVFEQEPPVGHRLFTLPNFVGTPHIGAGTIDSREQTAIIVVEQLVDYLSGKPARNRVA